MPEDQSSRKLFHNSEEEAPLGSLSDYIAKHLKEKGESSGLEVPETATENYFEPPKDDNTYTEEGEQQVGYILHHLDSQLISEHLEKYVPSPATRFHMTRERVGHELEALEAELLQYKKLGGKEYLARIEALEHRKALLIDKMRQLDEKLNDINPFRNMVQKLNTFGFKETETPHRTPRPSNPWRFIPSKRNKLTQEVSNMNGELESLQHILEEQLHDPNFSSLQMGRLINQYDAQLRRTERVMTELQSQRNIFVTLFRRCKSLIAGLQKP
jgi:hypothetical protein